MNFENNFLEKCPVGDTRSIFNKQEEKKKKVFLIQLIRGNFGQSLRQATALNSISKKVTMRVITEKPSSRYHTQYVLVCCLGANYC